MPFDADVQFVFGVCRTTTLTLANHIDAAEGVQN